MTKPFTHDGHTYTFERNRGVVTVTRDDGAQPWSTYPSYANVGVTATTPFPNYHAYTPAFGNIAEIKSLITNGHTDHGTFVHQVVWALTADDARRMREEMDNDTKSV